MRFHIPELLKKLKTYPGLEHIRAICCKTQPNQHPQLKKKKPSPQKLTAKTAASIYASAQKIKDQQLRKILEKIALNSDFGLI